MPAKKRTTSARGGSRSPGASRKKRVERDIRRAVDSIPELLADTTPPTDDMRHEHDHVPHKRRMLVLGVASFTLLILGLWLSNARTFASRVFAAQSTEAHLLSQAADNFEETLAAMTAADSAKRLAEEAEAAEREKKVAAALLHMFAAQAASATSTPTTTDDASLTE